MVLVSDTLFDHQPCSVKICSPATHIPYSPSGLFISSPYDVEARYGKKRTTSWVGYRVHVTETCEDDASHLITHVETTAGPVSDGAATPHIHQALERQGLLLTTHIVDTGYLDAELLVTSQRECHVDLLNNSARSLLALVENRMDALLTIRLMAEWHEVKFSALTVPTADAVPAEV